MARRRGIKTVPIRVSVDVAEMVNLIARACGVFAPAVVDDALREALKPKAELAAKLLAEYADLSKRFGKDK